MSDSSYPTKIECPECGGKLRKIGSSISNNHEFIDTQCVDCKTIIQVVLTGKITRDVLERFTNHILPFRRICQTSGKNALQIFDSSPTTIKENKDG